MIFRAIVDPENPGLVWWQSVSEHKQTCPAWARGLVFGKQFEAVTRSPEQYEQFKAWASKIPGWHGQGPGYAPFPLVLSESYQK